MSESLAEGLSVFGLVVGFPLLLLALMVSLERLETWGLRPPPDEPPDHAAELVEAAVESVEHMTVPTPAAEPVEPSVADGQEPERPASDEVTASSTRAGGTDDR